MTTNLTVRALIAALAKLPPDMPVDGCTFTIPEASDEVKAQRWLKQFSYDLDRIQRPLDLGAPPDATDVLDTAIDKWVAEHGTFNGLSWSKGTPSVFERDEGGE